MQSIGRGERYGGIISVETENIGDFFCEGNEAVLEYVLLAIQLKRKISNNKNRA